MCFGMKKEILCPLSARLLESCRKGVMCSFANHGSIVMCREGEQAIVAKSRSEQETMKSKRKVECEKQLLKAIFIEEKKIMDTYVVSFSRDKRNRLSKIHKKLEKSFT